MQFEWEEEDTQVWVVDSPPRGTPEDTDIQVDEEDTDIRPTIESAAMQVKEEEEDTNVWDLHSPPPGMPEDTYIQVKEEEEDIQLWDVESPPSGKPESPMLDGEKDLMTLNTPCPPERKQGRTRH
jgi:hypothetical protein